jgi:hypothetical protein
MYDANTVGMQNVRVKELLGLTSKTQKNAGEAMQSGQGPFPWEKGLKDSCLLLC